MKKNVGNLDRMVRIAAAIIVAAVYSAGIISGTLAYVLLGVSAVLLLTAVISFCPLYTLLGINTCSLPKRT